MSAYSLEKSLIRVLKENRSRYLDERTLLLDYALGEQLSGATEGGGNIARAIEILRLQGYEIDGDTTRGWLLTSVPDSLNYFELENALDTSFLGRYIFAYRMIGSTNETARALAESGAPDGALLVAEEQRQGRGRGAGEWYSPPGQGIYASLILRPGITGRSLGSLGMLAALSICLAVEEETGLEPRIKWPNDIYLGGRKAAGVLCQAGWRGEKLKYVILGFGINVNLRDLPVELGKTATSLALEAGREFYRVALCSAVIDKLEEGYFKFLADGFASFLPRVQVRDFLRGRHVCLETPEGVKLEGIARGINERGELLLERPDEYRMVQVADGHVTEWRG